MSDTRTLTAEEHAMFRKARLAAGKLVDAPLAPAPLLPPEYWVSL